MLAVAFAPAAPKEITTKTGCVTCKTGCSESNPCSGPEIASYTALKKESEAPLAKRSDISAGMLGLATTLETQLIRADFRERLIGIDPANAGLVDTVNKSVEEQMSILRRTGHAIGNSTGELNSPKAAVSEVLEGLNKLAAVQHTALKDIITPTDAELIAGIAKMRTIAAGDPEYTRLVERLEALPDQTRDKVWEAIDQIGEPSFTAIENLLLDTVQFADTLTKITVHKENHEIEVTTQDQAQLSANLISLPQDNAKIFLQAAAEVSKYTIIVASYSFPDIALASQKSVGYSVEHSIATTEHLNDKPLEFTQTMELALTGNKEKKIYERLSPDDRKLYGALRASILVAQQAVEVLELAASTPDRGESYVRRIDQINNDFGDLITKATNNALI